MSLHRRGHVFSIRVGAKELLNNWLDGIDCGLAHAGCRALAEHERARVLIGGLGMCSTHREAWHPPARHCARVVCWESGRSRATDASLGA